MYKFDINKTVTYAMMTEMLEFLTNLNEMYCLCLDAEFGILFDSLKELEETDELTSNQVSDINNIYDVVMTALSNIYTIDKARCVELQNYILALIKDLGEELAENYPPLVFVDMDLVVDVVDHREYLENYKKDLQAYVVMNMLRKQHSSLKPTAKSAVLTLVPKAN